MCEYFGADRKIGLTGIIRRAAKINKISNRLLYLSLQHPQWTVIKNSSLPSTLFQQALLSLVSYDKVCLITNCLVILYALLDAHISLTNRCIFLYLSTLERIHYLSLWDKKFRKCSRSLCTFKHKKFWMIRSMTLYVTTPYSCTVVQKRLSQFAIFNMCWNCYRFPVDLS